MWFVTNFSFQIAEDYFNLLSQAWRFGKNRRNIGERSVGLFTIMKDNSMPPPPPRLVAQPPTAPGSPPPPRTHHDKDKDVLLLDFVGGWEWPLQFRCAMSG